MPDKFWRAGPGLKINGLGLSLNIGPMQWSSGYRTMLITMLLPHSVTCPHFIKGAGLKGPVTNKFWRVGPGLKINRPGLEYWAHAGV